MTSFTINNALSDQLHNMDLNANPEQKMDVDSTPLPNFNLTPSSHESNLNQSENVSAPNHGHSTCYCLHSRPK